MGRDRRRNAEEGRLSEAPETAETAETPDSIAAHRAFERGDFFEARRLAVALERAAKDDAGRAAAKALLERLSFDPAIIAITVACVIFFVVTLALTIGR